MKKMMLVMLLWICCACSSMSLGSLEDETLQLTVLSQMIDENIETKVWNMNVLQEPLSETLCDDIYGIDQSLYQEVLIRRSLLEIACEEIVVFHAVDGKADQIVAQLKLYQNGRSMEYASMPNQQDLIEQGQIVKIGNYVFFVCSQDVTNVIQYISSLS